MKPSREINLFFTIGCLKGVFLKLSGFTQMDAHELIPRRDRRRVVRVCDLAIHHLWVAR
jgi:hypothetical protein